MIVVKDRPSSVEPSAPIRGRSRGRKPALGALFALALLSYPSLSTASSLFDDDALLEVSLTGPLQSVFDEQDDSVQQPFVLRANGADHAIKVRARGKSRRQICSFPPLRLNFAGKDVAGSVFEGQDKLKLVTHCQDRKEAQANLLQEYAAYRIFSLISETAYRVRLVQITYTDTDGEEHGAADGRYAFLIESSEELSRRLGGQRANVSGVSLSSLNEQHLAAVFVFQYLIGNTDWSLVTADADDACCHNGDLFDVGSDRYYIPYDFDLAGLVNARYARPDPSLRIQRVTQRLYRGFCLSPEPLTEALRSINALQPQILGVVNELPGLSLKDVDSTSEYLQKFFRQADDEEKMLRLFERRCL